MHRQVGDLVLDGQGVALRGLLVRHLVLPSRAGGDRGGGAFPGSGGLPQYLSQHHGAVSPLPSCL
jgi:hypothetical protein